VEALYIFILPPSMEELERRLRQRNAEEEAELDRRLVVARQEMAQYHRYDYVIVNDDLEAATVHLQAIILAQRCRVGYLSRNDAIFAQLDT
jgi:guanylate kinase